MMEVGCPIGRQRRGKHPNEVLVIVLKVDSDALLWGFVLFFVKYAGTEVGEHENISYLCTDFV